MQIVDQRMMKLGRQNRHGTQYDIISDGSKDYCQALIEEKAAHLLEFLNVDVQLTTKLRLCLGKR